MDGKYLLGGAAAVVCGVLMQVGVVLQKKVVNEMSAGDRAASFMKTLLKSPLWLLGMFLEWGIGSVAFMAAQGLVGPALTPGLMAAGLIVLALASVKFIHEKLSGPECAGIGIMIAGTAFLGLSELAIDVEAARAALAAPGTVARLYLFTAVLFLLWGLTHLIAIKTPPRKGIIMAFSNGFPFSASNLWVSPLIAFIAIVLPGRGNTMQAFVFVCACVILAGANVLAIRQIQESFKFGQASNLIPVQQIAVQITPVFYYFYVFALTPPKPESTAYILAGSTLIVVAGFLLGRRQAQMGKA